MNAATAAAPRSLFRFVAAVSLALLLALLVANGAAAAPAQGVSIGDRTQAQKHTCWASGAPGG